MTAAPWARLSIGFSTLFVVGSGLLSALAAGSPLGSLAAEVAGWQPVFLALAVLTVVFMIPQRFVWPRSASGARVQHPRNEVRVLERVQAVSVTACWGAAIYGFYTYLGTQLREHSARARSQRSSPCMASAP